MHTCLTWNSLLSDKMLAERLETTLYELLTSVIKSCVIASNSCNSNKYSNKYIYIYILIILACLEKNKYKYIYILKETYLCPCINLTKHVRHADIWCIFIKCSISQTRQC